MSNAKFPLSSHSLFQDIKDEELAQILVNAYETSPLVRDALWQAQNYNQQIYQEQRFLLNQNAALWTSKQSTYSLDQLYENVITRIELDKSKVVTLNQYLQSYNPAEGEITWSLATNKMEKILDGAKTLLSDKIIFSDVVQGNFPPEYDVLPPFPVFLGEPDSSYGNSQRTYLSAAIIEINLALQEPGASINHLSAEDTSLWVDKSAITHVTPIPPDLQLEKDFMTDFSFYFSDESTPQGFTFIHSGYAFGGQRFEARYPEGKLFGPEDCSSWVAKIIQCDFPFSTIDQLYTYRLGLPPEQQGYIDPNWFSTPDSHLKDKLSPVIIENPIEDIHAGQVFTFRTFNTEDHLHSAGEGGHTTLVLGLRENGNVVTLGYARDMPIIEGFGIQEFPWASTSTQEKMFFEVTSPILSKDDILREDHHIDGLSSDATPSKPYATESTPFQPFLVPSSIIEHPEPVLVI